MRTTPRLWGVLRPRSTLQSHPIPAATSQRPWTSPGLLRSPVSRSCPRPPSGSTMHWKEGLQDTLSRSVLANGSDRSSTRISKGGKRRRPSPRESDQARAAHCPLPAGAAGRRELSSEEPWADRVQPLPRDTHLLVAAEIRPCYKSLKRISMIAFYDQLTGSRHERGHFRGAAGGREGLPLQADPAEAWGSPSPWEEEKRFFPSCTHRENSQTWLHNFNRESE